MKNFESRFSAWETKFNSISQSTRLLECLTSLLLPTNAQVSENQRVTVLAAAAPLDSRSSYSSSSVMFLSAVTYHFVSSVVKQFDTNGSTSSVNASRARTTKLYTVKISNQYKTNFSELSKQKQGNTSMKYPCRSCREFGHCTRHHNQGGLLKPGFRHWHKLNNWT